MASRKTEKRSKASVAADPCGCVAKMNDALAPKGFALRCSTSLATGRMYMRVEVESLDSASRAASKRFTLVPTFCPFCGKRL